MLAQEAVQPPCVAGSPGNQLQKEKTPYPPMPGDTALRAANRGCYHGAAPGEWLSLVSGPTHDTSGSSSLFRLWLLFSAVGTNGVFPCLENLPRDLPAETFHFRPKLVSICSCWLGLLCPSEMYLIVTI